MRGRKIIKRFLVISKYRIGKETFKNEQCRNPRGRPTKEGFSRGETNLLVTALNGRENLEKRPGTGRDLLSVNARDIKAR